MSTTAWIGFQVCCLELDQAEVQASSSLAICFCCGFFFLIFVFPLKSSKDYLIKIIDELVLSRAHNLKIKDILTGEGKLTQKVPFRRQVHDDPEAGFVFMCALVGVWSLWLVPPQRMRLIRENIQKQSESQEEYKRKCKYLSKCKRSSWRSIIY